VLRVARFAARFDFKVAEETVALMHAIGGAGELDALVAERVWTETERALGERHPVRFFEVLRECGALKQVFPEIEQLFGIPQPKRYHPEIDSGIHTMMVLQQAARMSDDTAVRFAALVHDLGKGTTPRILWPSHRGHEERSVDLINDLCDRYRIPNRHRELAVIVARHHLDCHRILEVRTEKVLKRLEAIDAFRRPERVEQFLIACEADARGRKGMEQNHYPQAEFILSACKACRMIDTAPLLGQGLDGAGMAREIRSLRVAAIHKVQQEYLSE